MYTITPENILLVGSVLLFVSVLAGRTSFRFGIPVLLMFLFIGMLAGSEGLGGIHFDNPQLTQFIGIVSLNFILFSGGLDTHKDDIRPVAAKGIVLSTLGVLLTAFAVGTFVYYISPFTFLESLLLGSIVSSTDSAAVFSILRSKGLGLKNNIRPMLELESGSNDPMAYVLTITVLSFMQIPDMSWFSILESFVLQMLVGAVMGFVMGKAGRYVLNKLDLGYEGLYMVIVLALMFFTFSFTDVIRGNGFLAVYIAGLVLGNSKVVHKKQIIRFFDGMAWIMQIVLFLTLGLLVFPSEIINVAGIGIAVSIFMILVARPLAVFICLSFFKVDIRTKTFVSWVGLRGAVPIVFATYPLVAGVPQADIIFNIVFFITLISILFQGSTISLFAKWLKLDLPEEDKVKEQLTYDLDNREMTLMAIVDVKEHYPVVSKSLVDIDLPSSVIIAMIRRNKRFFIPSGSTVIEAGDKVVLLASDREEKRKTTAFFRGEGFLGVEE
ncbi:potassium/proton antiporter [Myroides phaeus]|uniref:Cell volume regulation protein A n=1 Tax=Myroides phaeus TaxID=702745 RepID=A0A1G8BR40_9FLAO|nr:potassium/proton antiporter [Myroides phaeus]SDH35601.1 cell volume regulation protein A [Myroides phaeus]